MDDLRFYILLNSVSVVSGRWEVDNERLCTMEGDIERLCAMDPCLQLKILKLPVGFKLQTWTAGLAGQCIAY